LDLRNEVLDSKGWQRLIEHLKTSPRPLKMVVSHPVMVDGPPPPEAPQEIMLRLDVSIMPSCSLVD